MNRNIFLAFILLMFSTNYAISQENSITIPIGKTSIKLIYVKAGTFTMGNNDNSNKFSQDESPEHKVTLTKDFYISETEVTQQQWAVFESVSVKKQFKGDNLPITNFKAKELESFLKKLNKKTKRTFRLPTEAEWEYCARGGNKQDRYSLSGSDDFNDVAWTIENSGDTYKPVKSKKPNSLGLYDMSGNVRELCDDGYAKYSEKDIVNPVGSKSNGTQCVRGGSFSDTWNNCRITFRSYEDMSDYSGNENTGFRLVLVAE